MIRNPNESESDQQRHPAALEIRHHVNSFGGRVTRAFVQVPDWLLTGDDKIPHHLLPTWLLLSSYANSKQVVHAKSQEYLAEVLGKKERQVRNDIAQLRERELVTPIFRGMHKVQSYEVPRHKDQKRWFAMYPKDFVWGAASLKESGLRTHRQLSVFIAMISMADVNGVMWAGHARIGERCDVSRTHVADEISWLRMRLALRCSLPHCSDKWDGPHWHLPTAKANFAVCTGCGEYAVNCLFDNNKWVFDGVCPAAVKVG